jgi:hypothetical protein
MAHGETVGTVSCNICDFKTVTIKEGKGGALSGKCGGCGAQVILRTPSGVSGFRSKQKPAAAPAAVVAAAQSATAKPDFLADL